jgi:hypothetical protein
MARSLKTIAREINDRVPGLTAEVVKSWSSTDRKIPGSRIRIPGKGRHGNRLIVRVERTRRVLLDHDASETYRSNDEVERWLSDWMAGFPVRVDGSLDRYPPKQVLRWRR